MGIRKLVNANHGILRGKAAAVKKITGPVRSLLDDMVETMYHHKGLGLAAPQLGIPKQVIVVDLGEGSAMKLVNPVVVESAGEAVDIEGCLSVPGIYGEVKRAEKVVVEGLDENDGPVRVNGVGLLARILQHEIDHLHGILFIDKVIRFVDPSELETKGESP